MAEKRLAMLADESHGIHHRDTLDMTCFVLRETLACGIAHRKLERQRDQQTWQADDEERDLPCTHIADDGQREYARVLEQRDHVAADEKCDRSEERRVGKEC